MLGLGPSMERDLGNGLVLRTGQKSDIKRIVEHVKLVHTEEIGPVAERVLKYHPDLPLEDNFLIEEVANGKVVAYLNLLRSRCVLNGTEFPVGHMEIVGTLPEYRNRGFIRILNEAFERRVSEYKLPLLVIAGIPYYYRLFGYEYAIPMGGALTVSTESVPSLKEGEKEPVSIKQVTKRNLDEYFQCRTKRNAYLDFYRKLTPEEITYLTKGQLGEELLFKLYLVKHKGSAVGSFMLTKAWGKLEIQELWVQEPTHILSILRYAKQFAQKLKVPLAVEPPSNPSLHLYLERIARSKFTKPYAWYVRIPSLKQFLKTIKPVLEARIAHSEFKDLTDTFRLSCYRKGVELTFKKGRLKDIKEIKREDVKDMHIALPPRIIYQLLMGYCSFDELDKMYPDVVGNPLKIPLANVLFPKIRAMLTPEF